MTDIDALRRETERLIDGDWDTEDLQDHICDLQTALDERQWRPMETCPVCQCVLLLGKNGEPHEGGLSEPDDRRYYTAWMPMPEPPK